MVLACIWKMTVCTYISDIMSIKKLHIAGQHWELRLYHFSIFIQHSSISSLVSYFLVASLRLDGWTSLASLLFTCSPWWRPGNLTKLLFWSRRAGPLGWVGLSLTRLGLAWININIFLFHINHYHSLYESYMGWVSAQMPKPQAFWNLEQLHQDILYLIHLDSIMKLSGRIGA